MKSIAERFSDGLNFVLIHSKTEFAPESSLMKLSVKPVEFTSSDSRKAIRWHSQAVSSGVHALSKILPMMEF